MKNSPPIGTLWSPIGYLREKEIEEEIETDTERASVQTTRACTCVCGDLMRFSDIIKKQIKPTETEFNRPKAKNASSESESVQKFEPGCPEIQILHRFFVVLPMVFE